MEINDWLQGSPVYAPASVTFVLADSTHQVASACMGPFEVQPHVAEQTFAFEPTLCLGGELLVCNIDINAVLSALILMICMALSHS